MADLVAFVTPMLRDPLRADRTELIVVDSPAADDPRQGSNDDDGSDTTASDEHRCEHGAASIMADARRLQAHAVVQPAPHDHRQGHQWVIAAIGRQVEDGGRNVCRCQDSIRPR